MNEWIAVGVSVVGSIVSAAFTYGAYSAKHKEMESRMERAESAIDSFVANYVPHKHFDAITLLLQKSQDEMQRDIKQILQLLGNRS